MPKSKPSFLQRLTGATDQEEELNNEQEMATQPKKQKKEQKKIQKNYEEKVNTKMQQPAIKEIAENKVNTEPPKEESWLSESEGQLTIDVYQTPTDIIIKSTIAGVNPENLDITITNDMVTVKGERKQEEEIKEDDYYYQECYWGKFSRSVILPVDVLSDKATAGMKNGVLVITLPKAEQTKTRKIQVKGA